MVKMKRKFDEAYASSYSEARSLVFNISIGKLQTSPLKPVEPSLWRSLLIIKTLHRITEELQNEASGTNRTSTADKGVEENALDENPLDSLFCLQHAPVAVLLSNCESTTSDERAFGGNMMETEEAMNEPASLIVLGNYLSQNLDVSDSSLPLHVSLDSKSYVPAVDLSSTNVCSRLPPEQDRFPEIDCTCLESFQIGDLSDISISLDQECLLGDQSALSFGLLGNQSASSLGLLGNQSASSFSALGSVFGNLQGLGSLSDLDCLMQVLEG